MAKPVIIPVTRGSGITLRFVWPDDAGAGIDLTGWALDLTEVSPSLAGLATIATPDPAAGTVEITIAASALPYGDYNFLRARATPPAGSALARTLPLFRLEVM